MLAWVLAGVLAVVALAAAIGLRHVSRQAAADRASAAADAAAQRERIAALERAADDLRASEASYRALVDAAPDWIWTCDPEGVLTFSNPAGARLLGQEELAGRPLAELTHPQDRPALRADGWSGVVRRGHADGTWRTVETSSIPVRDGEGRLTGWRGIDRDLTPTAPVARGLPERPGVAIVRWPVVDGRRHVVAYELVGDGNVLEGYAVDELVELGGGRPVWVEAPPSGIPALPPERSVLQLVPGTGAERAEALRKAGFTLAADDFAGDAALLTACGTVKVRRGPRRRRAARAHRRAGRARAAARGHRRRLGRGADALPGARLLALPGRVLHPPARRGRHAAGRPGLAGRARRADAGRCLVRGHRAHHRRRRRALAGTAALRQLRLLRAAPAARHGARGAHAAGHARGAPLGHGDGAVGGARRAGPAGGARPAARAHVRAAGPRDERRGTRPAVHGRPALGGRRAARRPDGAGAGVAAAVRGDRRRAPAP